MFTDTLTLSDGSVSHAYGIATSGENTRTRRTPVTSQLDKDELLKISHKVDPKKNISRSVVEFNTSVEDAAGNRGNIRIYTVYEIPRNTAVLADVVKVATQHRALLGSSGFDDNLVGYST